MATILRQPCDEGVIASGVAAAPCTKGSGPWILAATIVGSSMVFIDGTVVNVALPTLQAKLNATAVDVQSLNLTPFFWRHCCLWEVRLVITSAAD